MAKRVTGYKQIWYGLNSADIWKGYKIAINLYKTCFTCLGTIRPVVMLQAVPVPNTK